MVQTQSALSIKFLLAAILCGGATTILSQQIPESNGSGVQILNVHWRKQVRLPNNYDPAVIPTRGVFVDPSSNQASSLPGSGIDATRPPSTNPNTTVDSDMFPSTPRRLPVYYLYSLKIKNTGAKKIEGVAWTYTFFDRSTKAELGRHEFLSYRRLTPGAQGVLENPIRSPPTRVVKASESPKPAPQMTEQATVECVLFDDDTVWRNRRASVDACKALIEGHTLKRKPPPPRQN